MCITSSSSDHSFIYFYWKKDKQKEPTFRLEKTALWGIYWSRICIMWGTDKKELAIGKWATVAASSVVLEGVSDYALVAGNPAKIIKTSIKY